MFKIKRFPEDKSLRLKLDDVDEKSTEWYILLSQILQSNGPETAIRSRGPLETKRLDLVKLFVTTFNEQFHNQYQGSDYSLSTNVVDPLIEALAEV